MDTKDIQIVAQNAGTTAANIYAALLKVGHVEGWQPAVFEEIRYSVFDGVKTILEAEAVDLITTTFPGAQVQPPSTPALQPPLLQTSAPLPPPPPARPPAPPAAPAGGGGSDDKEHLWLDLAHNPDRWYDNRGNKRNPKGPDFKHKDSGEALWLNSRELPSWVPGHFGR